MAKAELRKPILVCLYGFPGSGKSYVARNLVDILPLAHVSVDRLRLQMFNNNQDDERQTRVSTKLALYLVNEFLRSGTSVVYDGSALTATERRRLRELAHKHKATYVLLWLQMDQESAFARAATRDKRTLEGKFAASRSRSSFNEYLSEMQNPVAEDYLVLSGKHTFASQKSAIISRLYQMGLVDSAALTGNVVKPELVNLVATMPKYDQDDSVSID